MAQISRELLHNTLSVQTVYKDDSRMVKYLKRFARKHDIECIEDNGNLYMTKGESENYPCVVAHMDTVHDIIPNFVVNVKFGIYTGKDRDTNKPSGVGGDDKVGVAIALHCLLKYEAVKVAFFRDEEIGCVGSTEADMSFFDDVAFVIQCDRRGNADVVHSIYGTTLYDNDFGDAIAPFMREYGFRETTGQLTDVYTLRKKGLDVASFNMSAGYHMPHTDNEVVDVRDVDNVLSFVEAVCDNLATKRWYSEANTTSYYSLFHTIVEEEEEEEAPQDFSVVRRWVSSGDVDVCPTCGDYNIDYDDTMGMYFCMVCLDYIFNEEEEEDFYALESRTSHVAD